MARRSASAVLIEWRESGASAWQFMVGEFCEPRGDQMLYCATGYLARAAGASNEVLITRRAGQVPRPQAIVELLLEAEYGIDFDLFKRIFKTNDHQGLDAVIELLQARGM